MPQPTTLASRTALRREAVEELSALIHMTRFMSDIVPKLVDDPERLKVHLDRLEAELQNELTLAGLEPAGRNAAN